ncbi:YMGG-like glycine zipper-containing protein, partial [Reyranella sp.]|uniref:YMGG-like glycine zipper-containing protein n=1 Tax=Reyranella sp. TaxID=1929291 RepID=UPI002F938752
MGSITTRFASVALALVALASGAAAQSYYDDQACRQYAAQAVAPLQNQVNSQAVGSALLGAGLGAAIGGAVGGGRGAGIGAASGAFLGGVNGAANAQYA